LRNKYLAIGLFLSLFISSVFASDVALVVKDANNLNYNHEYKVNYILERMGFDVTLIDKNSANVDYSKFALIVIAGRPSNVYSYQFLDSFVADIPVNDYPTVVIDSTYPDDFGWIEPGAVSTIFSNSPKYIKVENAHPILSGHNIGDTILTHIVGGQTVLDLEVSRSKLIPVASFDNSYGTSVISVAEPGQQLFNNKATQARAVFFGITNSLYWTYDAEQLFENAVWWVLADADDDGVLDHVDNCKFDSNPEQLDTDGDGIGDVCDLCPEENAMGYDINKDGCIDDSDNDGVKDNVDNCPNNYNPDQLDSDENGVGDECNILPGASIYLNVDADDVNESATNVNNVVEDGYEVYSDPNWNTNAISMSGDDDGFTDFLIKNNGYVKYWDPDDGLLTNVTEIENGIYSIDTDGDSEEDLIYDDNRKIFLAKEDTDDDGNIEEAKDNEMDYSFDEYYDEDSLTQLLSIVDGDNDGKNDFIIGINITSTYKPSKYWDPDDGILTNMIKTDVDNDNDNEYLVDIDGDFVYEKVYEANKLYNMPDLVVYSIELNTESPMSGNNVNVSAVVKNQGQYNANNFTVEFKVDDASKENKTIVLLENGKSETLVFEWNSIPSGSHTIKIIADADDVIPEESGESNNVKEMEVYATSSSTPTTTILSKGTFTGNLGGAAKKEYRVAELTGFPEQVVIKQGETKEVTGKFLNNLTKSIFNITFTVSGNGFNQSWGKISPENIESITMERFEDVALSFEIPEDAKIYTYPLVLKGTSNVNGIFKSYEAKINLLIQEKGIETTTTTIQPEVKETEEDKSPLSGALSFIKANKISLIIGVGMAGIIILLIVFREKLPKLEFKLKGTKQQYSFKNGWKKK